jgi:hypothetical protein
MPVSAFLRLLVFAFPRPPVMFHLYTGLRAFRAPVLESRLCLRPTVHSLASLFMPEPVPPAPGSLDPRPQNEPRLAVAGGFHLRTQRTKGTREAGWKPARDEEEEEEEEGE